jgi:hypothetical protein
MKAKPQSLGNINACGLAKLYDKKGNLVLNCLDTPNAIAVAFREYPKCYRVVGAWGVPEQFGKKQEFRADYKSRFNTDMTAESAGIRLAGAKQIVKSTPKKKAPTNKEIAKVALSTVISDDVMAVYYPEIAK